MKELEVIVVIERTKFDVVVDDVALDWRAAVVLDVAAAAAADAAADAAFALMNFVNHKLSQNVVEFDFGNFGFASETIESMAHGFPLHYHWDHCLLLLQVKEVA